MILSLTIPDDKIDQIKTALGDGTLLTNAQAKQALVRIVKNKVIEYSREQAYITTSASVNTAIASQSSVVSTAVADAEAISIT